MAEGFTRRFENNELTPAEAASRYTGAEIRRALEAVWRDRGIGICDRFVRPRPHRWCLPGGAGGQVIEPERK